VISIVSPSSPHLPCKEFLTVNELAAFLSVSTDTIQRLISRGHLRACNLSPHRDVDSRPIWRIARGDLADFINAGASMPVPRAPSPTRKIRSTPISFV